MRIEGLKSGPPLLRGRLQKRFSSSAPPALPTKKSKKDEILTPKTPSSSYPLSTGLLSALYHSLYSSTAACRLQGESIGVERKENSNRKKKKLQRRSNDGVSSFFFSIFGKKKAEKLTPVPVFLKNIVQRHFSYCS